MGIVAGKGHGLRLAVAHVVIICFLALILFPLFMIVAISLRPGNFATGSIIPTQPTLDHWRAALGLPFMDGGVLKKPDLPVLLWLWNSVKIAGCAAFGIVVISTTAAYAFGRLQFRFKGPLLNAMMLLQMFPAVLAMVGIYTVFHTIGKYVPWMGVETHLAVILAYLGGIAIHIWVIRGYYETIPVEIEECAKVDGATHFQTFRWILLPMALPILMVVFVLAFIGAMIEYPVASFLLRQVDHATLAVGMRYFLYEQKYLWGDFAAAAVLSGVPITVVFLLSQRWIISGLTSGAVKG